MRQDIARRSLIAGAGAQGLFDRKRLESSRAFFGVRWTACLLFLALAGGLGLFEDALFGAAPFFVIETVSGAYGAWYPMGLGTVAVFFAAVPPKGI